jgi:phosphatidate phosphatase APP1
VSDAANRPHPLPRAGKPPRMHNALVMLEDGIDRGWYRIKRALGLGDVKQVLPYTGYGNETMAWIGGRVLSDRLRGGPRTVDHWWANLFNTWQRWATAEVPGAQVQAVLGSQTLVDESDDEGYFNFEFQYERPRAFGWRDVEITCAGVRTIGRILIPPPTARFGIISDMDDTVIHTHITDLVTALRLTLLGNVKTRKPLLGVAELYQALQRGTGTEADPQNNPIFYVSSSAWNLFDLLRQFLELNNIPAGPLILRDIGLARRLTSVRGHWHKLDNAERIMAAYPHLPFVLIGDSGQQDATLYAEAVRRHPGRIIAVYIRDIDPSRPHARDERVRTIAREVEALGVPMRLVRDSTEIADHAASLGLISPYKLDEVTQDTARDATRPE